MPAVVALLAACAGPGPQVEPSAGSGAPVRASSATPVLPADPTRIRIASIGVDSGIMPVALKPDGAMQTPDFGRAGWYRLGPRPGEPGPAVVAAHVDSKHGPDVFFRLRELRPGDRISITDAGGVATSFEVESLEQTPKDRLPARRIWSRTDKPVLRLLTCGGRFNRATGHYDDNIIVYASPSV